MSRSHAGDAHRGVAAPQERRRAGEEPHGDIMLSKIMQPNAELGMNGQMGLPHK